MSLSRKLIVHVLLALLLFVGVSSVAAAPASTHEVVRSTASFTIPADQCPELPAGVSLSGTGESLAVINTRTRSDGSVVTHISNLIKGIATDSNGGVHTFVYENSSTDVALTTGLHEFQVSDNFALGGPGPNYSVGFNWRWTYTESIWPPVDNWEQISTRGDPFLCDPL